jgi:hypothetical protein
MTDADGEELIYLYPRVPINSVMHIGQEVSYETTN